MNHIIYEDIKQTISSIEAADVNLAFLKDSCILVTGATGFIGSFLIQVLLYLNQTRNYNIRIRALTRSEQKAQSVFGTQYKDSALTWIQGDVQNIAINGNIDYIIHGASITASREFYDHPVETIQTAVEGTRHILEIAKEKKSRAMVYLSSMEVFGITDKHLTEVREQDYGYIDILNPRSSYSESKRLCECLCASYAHEYGVPVKTARLTQTLGAGISYHDMRVASQFMRAVIEGHDIVLKTEGKTRRPIVYISDAAAGIITVLIKGAVGQSYTVANPKTTATIRETAELITHKIAKDKIKVVFDIDIPAEYAPNLNLNLNLNVDKLESLGWKAHIGLLEAYQRMISMS